MFVVSTIAFGEYFFDQGLQSAVVRTDYNATDEGTAANPISMAPGNILYPCNDPLLVFGCKEPTYPVSNPNYAPSIYSQAFPWSFNGGDTASNFWVLSMNNESWWDHDLSTGVPTNPGAPNWSLPRVEPGSGIMGFKPIVWIEGGENFYRFHLVLNQTFSNPQGAGALPFLSIGAAANRGNGGVMGYMNSPGSPNILMWNSKVWDVLENSQSNYWASVHFVYTTAEWGGKTRMLFVALYHESDLNGAELHFSDATNGTHSHWNWQMQESFYYPGADIAFMDAEDVNALCGFPMTRLRNVGENATYAVFLQALYRCASDLDLFDSDMPVTPVPITGVYWSNEGTGTDVALWTSVHNMRMIALPFPFMSSSQIFQTPPAGSYYPPIAASANNIQNEVSIVAERFRSSCKSSTNCWQANEQYLNGKRRGRPENPNKFYGTFQDVVRTYFGSN